jgi:hypothetical protein
MLRSCPICDKLLLARVDGEMDCHDLSQGYLERSCGSLQNVDMSEMVWRAEPELSPEPWNVKSVMANNTYGKGVSTM